MKDVVILLSGLGKTISFMESCTGGALANSITNVEGASDVLKFSAVTYSNEYKEKLGVSSLVIDEYSVYSMETAREMSKNISFFANSNYGVGVTGKLNRVDKNNPYGKDNVVYISIYNKDSDIYLDECINVSLDSREKNKEVVLNQVIKMLKAFVN